MYRKLEYSRPDVVKPISKCTLKGSFAECYTCTSTGSYTNLKSITCNSYVCCLICTMLNVTNIQIAFKWI